MIRLLACLVLLVACGDPQPAPPPKPSPSEQPPPPPPPPEPAEFQVPAGNLRGDAASGASTYALYCATCHGAGGKGDGIAAPKDPRPADHTDAATMGALSDADLYTVIQKGGPALDKSPLMTAWQGILTEQDTKDVIAHLRALSGT